MNGWARSFLNQRPLSSQWWWHCLLSEPRGENRPIAACGWAEMAGLFARFEREKNTLKAIVDGTSFLAVAPTVVRGRLSSAIGWSISRVASNGGMIGYNAPVKTRGGGKNE